MSKGQEIAFAIWIFIPILLLIAMIFMALHFRYFKLADKLKETFGVEGVLKEDITLFTDFGFYQTPHLFCYRVNNWKIGCVQYSRYTGVEYSRYIFYIQKQCLDYREGVYGKELAVKLGLDKSSALFLSDLRESPFYEVDGFKGAICRENTTTYFFETPIFNSQKLFQSVHKIMSMEDQDSSAA